jgi:glycine/D-amino acid oxidase-like deaminating enzyme
VYPRGDGSAYICGVSSETPVPESADLVDVRPEAIATLRQVAAAVSGALAGAPVLREQACYLPTTGDGLPLIGRLPGVEGAFIATGHSCWGILNAPATGLAMAELVVDGEASSVDVAPFDPARLMV